MDELEIVYQYEPRVFETRHGDYLPDFFLYEHGFWLEVKGAHPTRVEIDKLEDVDDQVSGRCVFLSGFPRVDRGGLLNACGYTSNGNLLSLQSFYKKLNPVDRASVVVAIRNAWERFGYCDLGSELAVGALLTRRPDKRYEHNDKANEYTILLEDAA